MTFYGLIQSLFLEVWSMLLAALATPHSKSISNFLIFLTRHLCAAFTRFNSCLTRSKTYHPWPTLYLSCLARQTCKRAMSRPFLLGSQGDSPWTRWHTCTGKASAKSRWNILEACFGICWSGWSTSQAGCCGIGRKDFRCLKMRAASR